MGMYAVRKRWFDEAAQRAPWRLRARVFLGKFKLRVFTAREPSWLTDVATCAARMNEEILAGSARSKVLPRERNVHAHMLPVTRRGHGVWR